MYAFGSGSKTNWCVVDLCGYLTFILQLVTRHFCALLFIILLLDLILLDEWS